MEQNTEPRSKERRPGVAALYWVSAAMLAAGAVMHVLFLPGQAVADAPFLIQWWLLAIAFVVFEMAVVIVRVQRDPHTVSLSDVPLVIGLLLASPAALIAGRVVGAGVALLIRRRPPEKLAFNLGMRYLETVVAISLLRALLGSSDGGNLTAWLLVLVAHTVMTVMSVFLVGTAIRVTDRRRRPWEIARSLATGFMISVGTGLVSLLFLIAAWSSEWAMPVVAVVTGMLYAALRVFGTLSDRHSELQSVHAFSTAIGMQESDATLAESTLRDLADTFGVGRVEIAAHNTTFEGRRWFFARLVGDSFTFELDDEPGVSDLIEAVAETGVVSLANLPSDLGAAFRRRGFGDGLVNGFRPNGLSGYIAVGRKRPAGRSFRHSHDLFGTLTSPMIANLERVALIDQLRAEVAIKEHQRSHDALTGLPNRTGFVEALEAAVEARPERLAVAVVDLDRFQEVNDVFGPERGDAVLREVAERLRDGIRSEDVLARLGNDEYAVLFNEVRGLDASVALARRIGDAFVAPFSIEGARLTLSASTGVSIYPDHGEEADTLLRRADMARSIAKAARGVVEVFDLEQDLAAERRLILANDLRPAIEDGGLRAEYQPKLEMATGRTIGFEALARWNHHQLGPISPVEFIQLAQHSGVIKPLTSKVLDLALSQVAVWRQSDPTLSVSVNVAADVLADEEFSDKVRAALDKHALPPDALVLEITESQSLADDRRTRDSVLRLASSGVMMSIDDFGTGYAALSYLQNLPVGEVKIDRSFVTRMAEHPGDRAIVEGTIALLHSVGLRVVAEGVETRQVWDLLADLGCYAAQGFLMSKPLPAEDARSWAVAPGWALETERT